MSAGFTPGPWHAEEMETRKRQYRVRCELGRANGGNGMIVVERIELNHDARLIAAAPDLYEAMEQLLDDMGADGLSVCQEAKEQALAALAKAREAGQ